MFIIQQIGNLEGGMRGGVGEGRGRKRDGWRQLVVTRYQCWQKVKKNIRKITG